MFSVSPRTLAHSMIKRLVHESPLEHGEGHDMHIAAERAGVPSRSISGSRDVAIMRWTASVDNENVSVSLKPI